MKLPKDRVIIASDVSGDRDGIGVEIYRDNKLIMEIFRDDTKRTRTVTFFQPDISLNLLEESIRLSKEKFLGTLLTNT